MKSKLYGTLGAAKYLHITQSTVTQQCRGGRIAARKVGRDYLIEKAELDRYRSQRQRLLSVKDGAAVLPKVRAALADLPITGVEFGGGRFAVTFDWKPSAGLYSHRGRLDTTLALAEAEIYRRKLARQVRAAMVEAGIGYVKTSTKSPF